MSDTNTLQELDSTEQHYFVSNVWGWAAHENLQEAIKRLAVYTSDEVKRELKAAHKDGRLGAYTWACIVDTPVDGSYTIESFAPYGVTTHPVGTVWTTYLSNSLLAYNIKGEAFRVKL